MKWAHASGLMLVAVLLPGPAPAQDARDAPEVGRIFQSTADNLSEEEVEAVRRKLSSKQVDTPAVFLNGVLADTRGMTLYVFDRDRPNVSTCFRICETLWPTFAAGIDDEPLGDFGIIERLDGSLQWTWRERPLYYWGRDRNPGDVTGDRVNEVWHVVRPD